MSRLTSNTYAAASPRARKIRSVHPIRPIIGATGALLLSLVAGCAQLQIPPPDAPAARLPQSQDTPALTDAQKQDLTRLNKHIYDEQETAIERERAQRALDDALRSYNSNAYFYGGWGSPGWYGPGWYGPGWYGPGRYSPRSSVGIGIGF
ncbi:hypothetical protein [Pandoraea apista]|uniref:hypothetical protein n=1 Tax=Pandoraea apista TaxID=93218 RepID=UPI00058A8D1D|nr:hypothetical protein [Pandoraea apista]AJE99414.1 hypothetical protein SG18_16600 [Pandoraea apista]AKH73527.1 hypothetical protein XM39_16795 [Pandoraea apista]AKI62074.1 hypothetical protein AA956_10105 [Pandoraea apista]